MKCANCGYFNLPNTEICGRCRRALLETDSSDAASSNEWLPPRASQRTTRQKVDLAVSPVTRRAIASVETTAQQVPQSVQRAREEFNDSVQTQIKQIPIYRPWAQSVVSLVPGLGQWWQGRKQRALELALIGIPITGFALLFATLSGWFVLLAAPIWAYSVFDAANYACPQANTGEGQRLRRIRLMLFAVLWATLASLFLLFGVYREQIEIGYFPTPLQGATGIVFNVFFGILAPIFSISTVGLLLWWLGRSNHRNR